MQESSGKLPLKPRRAGKGAARRRAAERQRRTHPEPAGGAGGSAEEGANETASATPPCCSRCCPNDDDDHDIGGYPPRRMKKATFRPLVGTNGDFLCDGCYRSEFPATAMIDEANADAEAEAAGGAGKIAVLTKRAVASAVTTLDDGMRRGRTTAEEEEEECRLCLDPGARRRCCGRYYCHGCYYLRAGPSCPGCGEAVHLTGISRRRSLDGDDPGRPAVGLTWALSICTALVLLVGIAASYVNWTTAPLTVWGRRCRGWFPRCDLDVCVDAVAADAAAFHFADSTTPNDVEGEMVENGGGVGAPPNRYRRCTLNSTVSKVVGRACAYDAELYDWTDGRAGYDFCVSSPREMPRWEGDGAEKRTFDGGAYVFEDDFDHWDGGGTHDVARIGMASARWAEMQNAEVSDICGANDVPRRYDFVDDGGGNGSGGDGIAPPPPIPPPTPGALVFSGVRYRYADTVDLDVRYGGRVEFYLKMGPLTIDDDESSNSPCKTAYGGDVTLSYSTDGMGETWTVFGTYPVYRYRFHRFEPVEEVIPPAAWTNRTRFRWRQPTFDFRREYWALDDVKVFGSFKPGWRDGRTYENARREFDDESHSAQCCLDTEQCAEFPNDAVDEGKCQRTVPGYISAKDRRVRLKSTEMFIVVAAVIALLKMIYAVLSRRVERDVPRLEPTVATGDNAMPEANPFPKRTFSLEKQCWWQLANGIVLAAPIGLIIWRLASVFATKGYSIGTIFLCTIALLLDACVVKTLLRDVFQVRPFGASLQVEVDTAPDHSVLSYGTKQIPLRDLMDIQMLSTCYMWAMYLCLLISALPYASGCMVLQTFAIPHDANRIYLRIVGACAIARSFLGANFVAKLALATEWIFTFSHERRDELGRALKGRGVVQATIYITCATFGLALVLALAVGGNDKGLIVFGGILLGVLLGAMFGIMRGIPVIPHIYLTRAPTMAHVTYYHKQVRCPCLFCCWYCSDLHSSQRLLVLYLDDNVAYASLLRGDVGEDDDGGKASP